MLAAINIKRGEDDGLLYLEFFLTDHQRARAVLDYNGDIFQTTMAYPTKNAVFDSEGWKYAQCSLMGPS
jgi:hypothetical protein